jgi:hypothetical protein
VYRTLLLFKCRPVAITGAFSDFFDYEMNDSHPGTVMNGGQQVNFDGSDSSGGSNNGPALYVQGGAAGYNPEECEEEGNC